MTKQNSAYDGKALSYNLRKARTDESIQLIHKYMGQVGQNREVLLGKFVYMEEGIAINPESDELEWALRDQRDNAKTVSKGLRLGNNGYAFVDYDTYPSGFNLDIVDFIDGSLARGLEHTTGIAKRFYEIGNLKKCPAGVACDFSTRDSENKFVILNISTYGPKWGRTIEPQLRIFDFNEPVGDYFTISKDLNNEKREK